MGKYKNCEYCKKEFISYRKSRKYCSNNCVQKYKSKSNSFILICIFCKKEYKVIRAKKNSSHYCSIKCKGNHQKTTQLGVNNSNYDNHILKGKKRSVEDIKKIKIGATKCWETKDRKDKHNTWLENYKKLNGCYPFNTDLAKTKSYASRALSIVKGKVNSVTHGICGNYISNKSNIKEWYQSSYELIRMQELDMDDNVITWTKKHKICIKLTDKTWYIPDFLIEYKNNNKILEEVKGYVRNKELFNKQIEFATKYCKENNIIYVVNYMNHLKNGKNKT